ncbi:MAG TPA: insulinase family protein [Puia sp.]|nr:insulinase family protein [Puia sp.]
MKKRKPLFYIPVLVSALILLLEQPVCSQFNLADNLPVDPAVKTGRLPNGLTYYIRKNTKPEKKVQLRLVVNVGSVLEDPDQQGLAHFMEHMNFNGSEHFPKNELVSYLQSIGVEFGADLNARTGFDETVYILPIPSDDTVKVDKGFTILEDWAGNALLDTTEINKERGVVLEESRLSKGAGERMAKKYLPVLFNGSKYASRLPIGKDDTIRHFKPKTLSRFYKTWYRPDLEAVIVVGDIDPAVAEEEIIRHFSHFRNPSPEKSRPAIIPIATRKANESMVLTDKEQPYTILQIYNFVEKSKPLVTWADYRESIVEELFSTIIDQRLNELTQQADPPFVFANTGFGSFLRGYRAFTSFAVLGDKPVKAAVDSLVSTLEAVKKFGVLQSELDRAKSSFMNQTETAYKDRDKTESGRYVESYINYYLSGAPIPGIDNRYKFLQQILPGIRLQEVNALAAGMENTQGKFVLLTAPEKSQAQLPSSKQLLDMVAAAHQLPVRPYQEKAIAKSLIDKLPVPGKIITKTTTAALGTTELSLSNGITITIRPTDFKNDEIKMDAWRWGGSRNYGLEKKQNAENASFLVQSMGVKDMSPVDLQKFLAGKTVEVLPYINPYDEGIQGDCSVKDFETFLQLVYLYFTAPRRDENLFHSYVNTQKAFVKNILANPNAFFEDTVSKIEYANSPWAGAFPKAGDFDKLNLDTALSIYRNIYGNAYGMHFTFVGNIDPDKALPLLEMYLGSLPSVPKENKFTDVGERPVKGVVQATIQKGTAKKSMVYIIFTGEKPYSQEENLKLHALTEVLTIKIIEQLREEMSGIYGGGMSGSLEKRPYNNYSVLLRFPCGPENVDKLTRAAFDIIKTAQEKGVEQKDLDKVKETLKKQNEDQMKQNDHWLDGLSFAWIERDDPMWILNYEKNVEALTVKDIRDAANKYLNMQNYIIAVLNPEKM